MIDQEKIAAAVSQIIEAIGDDPKREGLVDTPKRVAKAYNEIFSGMEQSSQEILAKTFTSNNQGMVVQSDIEFHSMCEHHFLPFFGKVHIAYLPNEKVVGLSKLGRTVEVYAHRPQLQEQLSDQIADALMDNLNPHGVMVVIEANHMCMSIRGVKKPDAVTKTIVTRGAFNEDYNLRQEALNLM